MTIVFRVGFDGLLLQSATKMTQMLPLHWLMAKEFAAR
jgi:hypothetical protein